MATNTYSGLTAEQKTFYNRTLLSRLTPNLFYAKYGPVSYTHLTLPTT